MGLTDETIQQKTEKLCEMIKSSGRIVAFTGAGVSTESNIPDFRSSQGLYNRVENEYGRPAEVLLSHSFFLEHTDIFYSYLKKYLVHPDAEPNHAHLSLAALESEGRLSTVVTQNIDGLHRKAGSKNVCELHGSLYRNYCMSCGKEYELKYITQSEGVPHCDKCGGIVRPDVVLYGEALDQHVTAKAEKEIRHADMLIIMGTSLVVYPAAGLVNFFGGRNIVIINKDPTPYDHSAKLLIEAPVGEIMKAVLDMLKTGCNKS